MKVRQSAENRKMGVNISLDLVTLRKLDDLARRTGLSRSGLIRRIVEKWAGNEEEISGLVHETGQRSGGDAREWVGDDEKAAAPQPAALPQDDP